VRRIVPAALRGPSLTIPLDRDIALTLKNFAEFFPCAVEQDVVSQTLSAVFYAILSEDTGEAHDAFTRILAQTDLHSQTVEVAMTGVGRGQRHYLRKDEMAWGQFLQLLNLFMFRFPRYRDFQEDLEDLIRGDERGPAEEIFHIVASRDWRYLRVH